MNQGGIDKLEVRVPARATYSSEFAYLYKELAYTPEVSPFRPHRLYQVSGDLREFGYSSILYAHQKFGRDANHKLELIDTGGMTLAGMQNEISKVFDVDAGRCEVMRVDLCADVRGVGIPWFLQRVKADRKRFCNEMGEVEYQQMGMAGVETLYAGKKPNMFRIYNKVAERRNAYQKLTRGNKCPVCKNPVTIRDREWVCRDVAASEVVSESKKVSLVVPRKRKCGAKGDVGDFHLAYFSDLYGMAFDAVITRVERAVGGGTVERDFPALHTVSGLRNAPDVNPFAPLQILQGGVIDNLEPEMFRNARGAVQFKDFLACIGLRAVIEQMGMHQAKRYVARYSQGNAARLFKRLAAALPPETREGAQYAAPELQVSSDHLYDLYRDSVARQVAA